MVDRYQKIPGLVKDAVQEEAVHSFEKLLSRLTLKRTSPSPSSSTLSLYSKGIYVYGPVGCGKTMLMDLFFESCKEKGLKVKRTHFHQFMLEIHRRIHAENQRLIQTYGRTRHASAESSDSVSRVAEELSKEVDILCFDEFQITDIADAWILQRLFVPLWSKGMVLIATSNRPIEDLYGNGLNRDYFLPFLKLFKERSVVIHMKSNIDYRLLYDSASSRSLPIQANFTPLSVESSHQLSSAFTNYIQQNSDSPGKHLSLSTFEIYMNIIV